MVSFCSYVSLPECSDFKVGHFLFLMLYRQLDEHTSCSCTSNQMWQRVATRIPIGFVAKALGLIIQSSTVPDRNKHPPTSFASENPTIIRESNNNLTWSCLKIWNSQIHPVKLYLCKLCKLCIIIFPTEIAILWSIPLHFKTNC